MTHTTPSAYLSFPYSNKMFAIKNLIWGQKFCVLCFLRYLAVKTSQASQIDLYRFQYIKNLSFQDLKILEPSKLSNSQCWEKLSSMSSMYANLKQTFGAIPVQVVLTRNPSRYPNSCLSVKFDGKWTRGWFQRYVWKRVKNYNLKNCTIYVPPLRWFWP